MANAPDSPPDDSPQLTADMRQQVLDLQWAEYDSDLCRQYPDKVVAVHQRKVLAVGDDMVTVFEEAVARSGLRPTQIALAVIWGPATMLDNC